ncbi:hypothetical protein AMS68_007171 [Peltaster fructicola]|uniref:Ecp2 effector protein domain-containing protein n=1 Tax=Peltaster fructicola TaxID=286661 RepID=A0A6H0Y3R8_9PEZI|nr:hypothetical protein AMS68_007171 [Peltaster fructicola]
MAPICALAVSGILFFSISHAIVLPASDFGQVSITPAHLACSKNASRTFETEATMVNSAVLERRSVVVGSRPEWLDCHRLKHASQWGDVFTGCYYGDTPDGYPASEKDHFREQLTELIRISVGTGTVTDRFHPDINNYPRWLCTGEENKRLCVSWSDTLLAHIEPDMSKIAIEKAQQCLYKHGYSSEIALFTFTGKRVNICITSKPGECERALCEDSRVETGQVNERQ